MRNDKYHIYLDNQERKIVIHSLNEFRNKLIREGKYTDLVDELINKVMFAKIKKIKIEYV